MSTMVKIETINSTYRNKLKVRVLICYTPILVETLASKVPSYIFV